MSLLKKITASTLAIAATVAITLPVQADAASANEILNEAAHARTEAKMDIQGSTDLLEKSVGYLVFPEVYEGGIGIGGEYGEGVLMVNNKAHSYYNMVSASYGLKLGAQKKSVFIAFTEQNALDEFINSNGWEIGADASVVLLNAGTEGSINTSVTNQPVVAFVTDQEGLMYDLSLEGTKVTEISK